MYYGKEREFAQAISDQVSAAPTARSKYPGIEQRSPCPSPRPRVPSPRKRGEG